MPQNTSNKLDKKLDRLIISMDKSTLQAREETKKIQKRMDESREKWRRDMAKIREEGQRDIARIQKEGQQDIAKIREERQRDVAKIREEGQRDIARIQKEGQQDIAKIREEAQRDRERSRDEYGQLQEAVRAANKQIGDFVNSEGLLLEDEFCQALQDAGRLGDIDLDYVIPRLQPKNRETNYDLVGFNGDATVVGEVKRTLSAKKITQFAENTLPQFVNHFPSHKGKKIYGLVAAKRISPKAEKVAADYGLFIVTLKHRHLIVLNSDCAKAVSQAQ